MRGWYVGLLILSLVGFVGSWSGDLVLTTSIMTFGLMLPVWYIAANLWWVLLALLPAMLLRERGRVGLGLAMGVGAVVAMGVGASVLIWQARETLTSDLPLPEPGLARKAGAPDSVEISVLSEQGWDISEEPCGRVCRALLTGPEVHWLRIQIAGQKRNETYVFERAETSACLALDPGFSATTPCILAREDDRTRADLRIEITQAGNFWGPMDQDHGMVYLTGIQTLKLIDNRGSPPQVLDERRRYAWSQPVIGPLRPGMTALGSGVKYNGPSFKRVRGRSGEFDVAGILAHAGVRLGAIDPPPEPHEQRQTLYSTALLVSILAMAEDGKLSPGQSQLARAFLDRIRPSSLNAGAVPDISEAERNVLRMLTKVGGDRELERSLTSLMAEHPDYFVEDFGALLRIVVTGTPVEAERAAKSASLGLFRSKRGDHDDAWPDYVAAIESGRSGELIRWGGRFNHDPLPVLRAELMRVPVDRHAWDTMSAVCHIDQRWWDGLIPFYHDIALGYVPKAGDIERNGMELHYAVRALVFMGRRDLAEDVVNSIDWSHVAAMPSTRKNPGSLEQARESTMALPDQPLGC